MTSSVVFWDFDGTLARRDDLWAGALLDALTVVDPKANVTLDRLRPGLSTGFPWHTPDEVVDARTPDGWWWSLRPTFLAAYHGAGVHPSTARAAADRVREEFYRQDAWELIDGSLEALSTTRSAGYRNVILSNHGPELPQLVEALGLADFVDLTITSAAVGAEKPNPRIFEFALAKVGVHAHSDVWMVGDNPIADVEGAERLGIRAILADGAGPGSRGRTVLSAAEHIASESE